MKIKKRNNSTIEYHWVSPGVTCPFIWRFASLSRKPDGTWLHTYY